MTSWYSVDISTGIVCLVAGLDCMGSWLVLVLTGVETEGRTLAALTIVSKNKHR